MSAPNTTSMSAQARRWWQAAGRTTGCTGRDPWAGAWQLLSCTSSCSGWGQERHTSIFVLGLQKSLSKTLTYQPWARLTNLLKSNVWADSSSSAVWKIGEEVGFYFHILGPREVWVQRSGEGGQTLDIVHRKGVTSLTPDTLTPWHTSDWLSCVNIHSHRNSIK